MDLRFSKFTRVKPVLLESLTGLVSTLGHRSLPCASVLYRLVVVFLTFYAGYGDLLVWQWQQDRPVLCQVGGVNSGCLLGLGFGFKRCVTLCILGFGGDCKAVST